MADELEEAMGLSINGAAVIEMEPGMELPIDRHGRLITSASQHPRRSGGSRARSAVLGNAYVSTDAPQPGAGLPGEAAAGEKYGSDFGQPDGEAAASVADSLEGGDDLRPLSGGPTQGGMMMTYDSQLSTASNYSAISLSEANNNKDWEPEDKLDRERDNLPPPAPPASRQSLFETLKFTVTLGLFLSVLLGNLFSKLSFLALTRQLHNHADKDEWHVAFVLLLFCLLVPQALSLLHNFWLLCFKSRSGKEDIGGSFFPIFVGATLEGFGSSIFVFIMAPELPPLVTVAFMAALVLLPSLSSEVGLLFRPTGYRRLGEAADGPSPSRGMPWVSVLVCVVQAGCLGFLVYQSTGRVQWYWQLLGTVSLSASFVPYLFHLQCGPGGSDLTMRSRTAAVSAAARIVTTILVSYTVLAFARSDPLEFYRIAAAVRNLHSSKMLTPFLVQIFTSFFAYHAGRLACRTGLPRPSFALPLLFATPITLVVVTTHCSTYKGLHLDCPTASTIQIALAIGIWACEMVLTMRTAWNTDYKVLSKDEKLFLRPSYNGIVLEQYLLLNRRRPSQLLKAYRRPEGTTVKPKVYICTTMYREVSLEMKQLLHSLYELGHHRASRQRAQATSKAQTTHYELNEVDFEAHVFMDGAASGDDRLGDFALQLLNCIVDEEQEILKGRYRISEAAARLEAKREFRNSTRKIRTPYGMRFERFLPGDIPLVLHFKDPTKIKKKKRWSQVMYMYYIVDYRHSVLLRDAEDTKTKPAAEFADEEELYVLATDADVKFRPKDVQALLTTMGQDRRIGAVCARTHPIGSGPLVWYQKFDYAIGHWFQKTAEHVLGTVLCCPGCFSLYRFEALVEVRHIYASHVDQAFDFLTKDMGEDRWLCTLLVQHGWKLHYTAASHNQTHCPESFDEFYNQRRRWIPSTVANIVELLSNWQQAVAVNNSISIPFIMYEVAMLFSSLISPGTVMLVVTGGVVFVNNWNEYAVLAVLATVVVGYGAICLTCKPALQLQVAKVLTVLFALVMAAVAVGVAAQVADEAHFKPRHNHTNATQHHHHPKPPNATGYLWAADDYEDDYEEPSGGLVLGSSAVHVIGQTGLSLTSVYLIGVVGMFLLAGIFHFDEISCLVHGLWYLFFLPSGYLFLNIYAICNLNSQSWGTREAKVETTGSPGSLWTNLLAGMGRHKHEDFWHFFGRMICCVRTVSEEAVTPKKQSGDGLPPISWELNEGADRITCGPVRALVALLGKQILPEERTQDWLCSIEEATATARLAFPDIIKNATWVSKWSVSFKQFVPQGDDHPCKDPAFTATMMAEIERVPGWRDHVLPELGALPPSPATDKDFEDIATWLRNAELTGQAMSSGVFLSQTSEHGPSPLGGHANADPVLAMMREAGYDDTSFLVDLKHSELITAGLNSIPVSRHFLDKVLFESRQIPRNHLLGRIPETLDVWLAELRLSQYRTNFVRCGFDLETDRAFRTLEYYSQSDLAKMGISRPGHIRKLKLAIQELSSRLSMGQVPKALSGRSKMIAETRSMVAGVEFTHLENSMLARWRLPSHQTVTSAALAMPRPLDALGDQAFHTGISTVSRGGTRRIDGQTVSERGERLFWRRMLTEKLDPQDSIANVVGLREKLLELRNYAVLVLLVTNAIWLVLMLELAKSADLKVAGANPLGVVFLIIFGLLQYVQFFTLVWHRLGTFVHEITLTRWEYLGFLCGQGSRARPEDPRAVEDTGLGRAPLFVHAASSNPQAARSRRPRNKIAREYPGARPDTELLPVAGN